MPFYYAPRSGSDRALLSTARAFASDALPLKDEFIRHELPATCIEDLRADIADMEHSIGSQNTGRGTHVIATVSIDEGLERGMSAVRKLDAVVRNKFRDDPAALAAWESARHVERHTPTPRRTNGDSTGAPASPPQYKGLADREKSRRDPSKSRRLRFNGQVRPVSEAAERL